MKCHRLLQIVVAGCVVGGLSEAVRADDGPKRDTAKHPILERILKEFDQDGSGRLNAEELAAARRKMEQVLAQISEEGANSKPEAPSADAAHPNLTAILKRFDKDGDGKLSAAEKAEALRPREGMGQGPGNDGRPNIQEVMKRFDKNGDGQLSDEERAAARAAFGNTGIRPGGPGSAPTREEIIKRFDKDGDGKLNDEEQAAARTAFEQRRGGAAGGGLIPGEGKQQEPKVDQQDLLKKFDKDGDGKLSAEEKAKAREAFQNRESPKKD